MKWLAHLSAVVVLGLIVIQVITDLSRGEELAEGLPFIFTLGSALVVGWLLAWRLPRNPLGWILMLVPAWFSVAATSELIAFALLPVAPGVSTALFVFFGGPGIDTWAWLPPVWLLLSQLPLRFPTGRLPSPRWRGFQWFSVAALVLISALLAIGTDEAAHGIPNPIYVAGIASQPALMLIGFGSLGAAFVGSIASLFVRYRGGSSLERTQIRWVLWALAVAVGLLIGAWIVLALELAPDFDFSGAISAGYALIPIAIGVSVLRYRLYEIDRIISRTASYAIVSLIVVGVYLLVVTSVHWILPDLPAIGVALATLAAAALFLPVLRWVRRLVDRRFDRERYNAEKVVDAFGEHLRTDLDPHSTSGELVEAIEKTLQPTSVGIWTAGGPR